MFFWREVQIFGFLRFLILKDCNGLGPQECRICNWFLMVKFLDFHAAMTSMEILQKELVVHKEMVAELRTQLAEKEEEFQVSQFVYLAMLWLMFCITVTTQCMYHVFLLMYSRHSEIQCCILVVELTDILTRFHF